MNGPPPMRLRLRITLLALRAAGWRAAFACGAVALAIAAVTVLFALENGARRELDAIAERVGRNLFAVNPARVPVPPGRGEGWVVSTRLRREDAERIRRSVAGVRAVLPILEGSRTAKLNGREHTTSVRGVTPEFFAARNFDLQEGRLIDGSDDASRSRVAVVGPFVAERLNGGVSLVGETLVVGEVALEVVGQLVAKGISDGQNEDDQIVVPLETARRRVFNVEWLSRLLVQAGGPAQIEPAQRGVREVLRDAHRLDDGLKDDFEILSLVRLNQIRKVNNQFLAGLAGLFAAITLAVGGAGVLAVTWLNARDRTAEIGLRMAVGARRRDIAGLFLAEACALSGAGGLLGIAAGALAAGVLRLATGWQMVIEARGLVVPFATALALGLIFGVAPALRAAGVQPVDALRDR